MGDKIAFVFDTNFIIQNHDLETVTQKLMEHDFVAYVTQVAIDERIAQECNKQKEKQCGKNIGNGSRHACSDRTHIQKAGENKNWIQYDIADSA